MGEELQEEEKRMASGTASARRKRRSGGGAILEGAFTLIPTFALIIVFADVGLMLFRWGTLQNAVREGCRYAITFQTMQGLGQDDSIKQVVARNAMGLVSTSDTTQHIFVNYYSTSDLTTPISGGGNSPGNLVEVSVQNASWSWIMPLSGTSSRPYYITKPFTVNVYSSDILGGYPAGVTNVPR